MKTTILSFTGLCAVCALFFISCEKPALDSEDEDKSDVALLTEDILQYVDYYRPQPNQIRQWSINEVKVALVSANGHEEVLFYYDHLNVTDFPMMHPHYIDFYGNVSFIMVRSLSSDDNVKSPLERLMPLIANWVLSPDGKKLTISQNPNFPHDGPTGAFDVVYRRGSKTKYEDGSVIYNSHELTGTRTTSVNNGKKQVEHFRITNTPYNYMVK